MFTPNKELLQQIMVQFLKESYPDTYTSDEAFENDIDPEHIKSANDFVSQLVQDPDAETKFKDIADSLGYDGDLEDTEAIQFAKKGAKLKALKTKKCKCGCDMITVKAEGGKLTSTCACKCGGKIKKATPKKRIGGELQQLGIGGVYRGKTKLDYTSIGAPQSKTINKPIVKQPLNTTYQSPNMMNWKPNTPQSMLNNQFRFTSPTTQPTQPIQQSTTPTNRYANVGSAEKIRVAKWQAANGLKADGIWGPKTQAMYKSLMASGKIGRDGQQTIQALPTPKVGVQPISNNLQPINQSDFDKTLKVNPAYQGAFDVISKITAPIAYKKGGSIKKIEDRIKKAQTGTKITPTTSTTKKKLLPKQGMINNTLPKDDGDEYAIPIGNDKDDNNTKKTIKPIAKKVKNRVGLKK